MTFRGLLTEFERAKKEFEKAVAAGDMERAKKSALRCASILRHLAKHVPYNGGAVPEESQEVGGNSCTD